MHSKSLRTGLYIGLIISLVQINVTNAQGGHTHGQAHIYIILDDKKLVVDATLSASDIVGFEYQPKNEAELQSVDTALKTIANTEQWLLIVNGACTHQSTVIDNPFGTKSPEAAHADHNDFAISVKYNCEKPDELTELEVKLTKIYSQIHDIEIQWLVHGKQGLAYLHGNTQKVRFE